MVAAASENLKAKLQSPRWWAVRVASGIGFFLLLYVFVNFDHWTGADVKARTGSNTQSAADEREEFDGRANLRISNVRVKDQSGQLIYDGSVDVSPTVDRIARNERLDYKNDGSVFENRERRLPSRPAGYYREWVHPTPDYPLPGPQRVVTGKNGDIWYTPNHYKSFVKLK